MRQFLFRANDSDRYINAGCMTDVHFEGLVLISSIHSKKTINALREYLVNGISRKDACKKHTVSQGYFSVCLKKVREANNCASKLAAYYYR